MTAQKSQARLKNYSSAIEVDESLAIIRRALATHQARRIIFEGSDEDGNPTGLSFVLELQGRPFAFRLPVYLERTRALVRRANQEAHVKKMNEAQLGEQTARTAWTNIKDWILAQMALIESGGPRTEEVFFPYMMDDQGQTTFEAFERRLALPAPKQRQYAVTEEGR